MSFFIKKIECWKCNQFFHKLITTKYHGIYMQDSSLNIIEKNIISLTKPGGKGFELFRSDENQIQRNRIINTKCGFYLVNSDSNIVSKNEIKNAVKGIIMDNAQGTSIIKNNFKRCIVKAHFSTKQWNEIPPINNTWFHNYWNRPRILPKVIVGIHYDFRYDPPIITRVFEFDWFPAKIPNVILF